MYSRVTSLEIDTLRTSMAEAEDLFRSVVLPELREQMGFEGVVVLTTDEGRGMIITLWATQEAAIDAATFASGQLARHMTLFRSPPGREYYRVAVSELPHQLTG